jgi:peptide maturation system protein (TIGR04066 family)
MLAGYDEVIPVAEGGAGTVWEGSDISSYDLGAHHGLKVSADFENAVKCADSILLNSGVRNLKIARAHFQLAKNLGKHIMACRSTFEDLGLDGSNCELFPFPRHEYDVNPESELFKIPVPVILILGIGQLCNKFEIQLGLRKKFLEMGYNVSQVGTKEYSPLFGLNILPDFTDAPLWKKILLYNRYFREIVDKENPDVLIAGAPGGIMPIDEWHNEMFGETAIAISKSLDPDAAVLSMYQIPLSSDELNGIKDYAKYALGVTPEFFHISNNKLVFEQDMRTINYMFVNSETTLRECKHLNEAPGNFFNIHLPGMPDRIYENIILGLQGNVALL